MRTLATIETLFQDNVLTGNPAITGEIEGDDENFRDARLAIYRHGYRLRLIEVLATDYGVLQTYLGDELFKGLADEYIAAHPSTFRNVRWFGGKMADFLGTMPRYATHPELSELARFEWSLGQAFDAADESTVTFEKVAAVPAAAWANLSFTAHPSLRTIELRTNAVAIWKAIGDESAPCVAETLAEPVSWAIWRKQHSPFFRSMQGDEAWALKAVLSGASFGQICEGLCGWVAEDQAPGRAAGLLRGWVEEGWIAALVSAA